MGEQQPIVTDDENTAIRTAGRKALVQRDAAVAVERRRSGQTFR
jgi:hypothetical protein